MVETRRSRRRRCPAPASSNGSSGEDHISSLPNELLHVILVRLSSAQAAARISVLSRRWRHVWAHLPKLRFVAPPAAVPTSFMYGVNAALRGYLALTVDHLSVSISAIEQQHRDLHVPSGCIASWLRFAAEHVASGLFAALTWLSIDGNVCMEGSDVTALVNTQCPCLRNLKLSIQLIVIFDVFIHSKSLRTLELKVLETRRLEILAPTPEVLSLVTKPMEAHISAPKLLKVVWDDAYDPHLHRFVDVGRTLQVLKTILQGSSLSERFDEVDVLDMNITVYSSDAATYGRFLNERNKLPKCKIFNVLLTWEYHALVPIILQLLSSCNGTKMFRVELFGDLSWSPVVHSCLPPCPCRLEESRKIEGVDLSSLEHVEIIGFSGSDEQLDLVEFISSKAGILKRLVIIDWFCRRPREAREKIRSMCHPNVRVEFYGFRD